ncbi:flagellar export chaperone FlgN [Pandoraea cepalis]|uniref:Flagellar protein FlgN n=1 Tax=Pandoraea cepalis TaxID=2508294 RepID=A0A5E4WEP5_9BURK|nr:flagellar export chaperone FlgN [Pandoraea cepalis]VVE22623.1 flagellar protein FlgN [Pandoraea cepalis]
MNTAAQRLRRECVGRIVADVDADLVDYHRLIETLDALHRALVADKLDTLTRAHDRAAQLVSRLRVRARRRVQCLEQAFGEAAADTLAPVFQWLDTPARDALSARWQALQASAARCKAINTRNLREIGTRLHALDVVLSPASQSATYTPPR